MSIYFNLFHSGKLLFPRAAASHLHGVTGPIAQLTPVDGGSFTLVHLRMVGNPWENTWKWMEMVDLGMMKLGRKTQRFFRSTHGLKRWFYLDAFCLIMTEAVKWMITRKQHWWSGQPGGQIHKNQRWTANGSRAEYHLSQPSRANHLTWQGGDPFTLRHHNMLLSSRAPQEYMAILRYPAKKMAMAGFVLKKVPSGSSSFSIRT